MKKQIAFGIRVLIFIFIAASLPDISQAQECSEAALFQKYWQYKKRFNRSFIVQDRDSSGCVNDGIGFTASNDTSSSCKFEKEGYGLPATNLRISPVGWGVPGGELNDRFNWPDTSAVIYDRDCGGDISGWGNNDNKCE